MMTSQQRRDRLETLLERVQKNRQRLHPSFEPSSKATPQDDERCAPPSSADIVVEQKPTPEVSPRERVDREKAASSHFAKALQDEAVPEHEEELSPPKQPEPDRLSAEISEKTRIATFDIAEVRERFNASQPSTAAEDVIEEISEDDVEFVDEETDSLPSIDDSLPSIDDFPPPEHTDDAPTRVVLASSIFPPAKTDNKAPKETTVEPPPPAPAQGAAAGEPAEVSSPPQEEEPRVFSPRPRAGGDVARVEGAFPKKSYSLAAVLERAWKYGANH